MYRRFNGTELWHCNAGCSSWPLRGFEEKEHPVQGQVCSQCLEIEAMVSRLRFDDFENFSDLETGARR